MATFNALWIKHPGSQSFPCNKKKYENQCAIRMSVAIQGAGISMADYKENKCDEKGHIVHARGAQALANWIETKSGEFGVVKKYSNDKWREIKNAQKGIVLIVDFWGNPQTGDHIDLWDGASMKGGSPEYFDKAKKIWFWEIQ